MIKTIIIDDEPLAIDIIKNYLKDRQEFEISAVCHDGFSGLKAIQQHQPDLIFLDIQMPKITGFELLELLENPPAVIFATAFDEFAIKAFEKHAVDYLLKPFSKERFEQAIDKYNAQKDIQKLKELLEERVSDQKAYLERIVLKERNEIIILPISTLHFLQANDDFVNIHSSKGKYIKNKTLTFYEQQLDPDQFVRVHRSYIVKIDQITKLESYKKDSYIVILKNGEQIPLSKSGYPKLKAALGW